MFHSRAKRHRVEKFIERLEAADTALCNAALCNVLTKSQDVYLRDRIALIRDFADRAKRAASDKRER